MGAADPHHLTPSPANYDAVFHPYILFGSDRSIPTGFDTHCISTAHRSDSHERRMGYRNGQGQSGLGYAYSDQPLASQDAARLS